MPHSRLAEIRMETQTHAATANAVQRDPSAAPVHFFSLFLTLGPSLLQLKRTCPSVMNKFVTLNVTRKRRELFNEKKEKIAALNALNHEVWKRRDGIRDHASAAERACWDVLLGAMAQIPVGLLPFITFRQKKKVIECRPSDLLHDRLTPYLRLCC